MAKERGIVALDRPGEALRLYSDSEVLEAARRTLAREEPSAGEEAGRRLAALLQQGLGAEETARPGEGIVVASSPQAALELIRRALGPGCGRLRPADRERGEAGRESKEPGAERRQPRRNEADWEGIEPEQQDRGSTRVERERGEQGPGRESGRLKLSDERHLAEEDGADDWQVELRPDSAWSWRAPMDAEGKGGRRAALGPSARRIAVGSLASGAPGLGAAWASGPPELLRRVREQQRRAGAASGWELLVLEELLGLGELEPRRAAAAAACEAALRELEEALGAASMPAGLRWRRDPRGAAVELLLPEGLDARALQRAARLRGLRIGVAGAGFAEAPDSGAARLAAGAASGAQLALALSGLAGAMREFTARS
ncbi:hypothetical protein HGI30_17475 [Paenibacillus albicereus]|uniref:Uncharacterized protein n=1 Tax=Paenibacillus albicereus TaxID=2726185 RepID=A0A6H2H0G7_9BACL|nr:hypothetical protein [Paenibacillus albicereus]QJC53184.1 hypothetical protein HGI30_17475 [Paenibacillus albicereus]